MDPVSTYQFVVADDREDLIDRASHWLVQVLRDALAQSDRVRFAISGGRTPEPVYGAMGSMPLPWERVDLLLGDERWVPVDDPASNGGMVQRSLLAAEPGCRATLHQVPTDLPTPTAAASRYDGILRQLSGSTPPWLDLALLGLGDDGHTASLFPGTAAVQEREALVTTGVGKGLARITLTAPCLSSARQVAFLISGGAKAQALRRLLDPDEDPLRTPACLIRPATAVTLLLDRAAAEAIDA